MTSIINSSNTNSALIQTVEASDSMSNPSVYNVKPVNPTYAATWVKNIPINGNAKASSTQNWNLQKYGIIQQILFSYTKTITVGTAAGNYKIEPHDIFNVIDKIELLSSSRVVAILTAADLAAQFSNLQADEFACVQKTCLTERTNSGTPATGTFKETYVVPLHFGFMDDVNLNLNSSFLETLSVRVSYGPHIQNHTRIPETGSDTATVAASNELTEVHLRVLYKSLPESATAQMLAQNFSSDSLVQVSTRFYDENPEFQTGELTGEKSVDVDLKNTDCVESFYVMARLNGRTTSGNDRNAGFGPFLPITEVKMTGSGQEILTLGERELPYTKLKANGWPTSLGMSGNNAYDAAGLGNIVKVQQGLYGCHKLSNTLSLREVNAPRISVKADFESATEYRIDVCEHTTAIYQIASNTGRLALALSN